VCWFLSLVEQLAEIRKVTLAKVICHNSDNIATIQPNVMLLPFRQVYQSSVYVAALRLCLSRNSVAITRQ